MTRVQRRIGRHGGVRDRGSPTGADRTLRLAVVAGLLVILATLSAGCFKYSVSIPADLRTPDMASVVEAKTQLPNGHWQYQLANGQTLEIDYDQTTSLLGGPDAGRLLLAGTDPDGRQWVAGVRRSTSVDSPPGCFDFPAQGRASDGWIETESGFRLPKAAGFSDPTRDNPSDLFTSDQGWFCLNEKGEVTRYVVR